MLREHGVLASGRLISRDAVGERAGHDDVTMNVLVSEDGAVAFELAGLRIAGKLRL